MTSLRAIGQRLASGLLQARQLRQRDQQLLSKGGLIDVIGTGGTLTAAYEQLRNAAENSEEHLLLQNAIKRFYRQIFLANDEKRLAESGNELVIELTQAGYVPNNSLRKAQAEEITARAAAYATLYDQLKRQRSVSEMVALRWVIEVLAVEIAQIVQPRYEDEVFVNFAYEYFSSIIPASTVEKTEDFGAALFVAIHRALLKSDSAGMRTQLLRRYGVQPEQTEWFMEYNRRIDTLIEAPVVDRLYHTVDRQGAPLRVLWRMIASDDTLPELLGKRSAFLNAFEHQVTQEYSRIATRINRAVVRSVIFLLITKVLIGVAIEVPYDLMAHGAVLWVPLAINLLFPPIYMVLLRFTLAMPGRSNTAALVERIDAMLYGGNKVTLSKVDIGQKRYSMAFSVAYGVASLIILGLVAWLLVAWQFSFVHIIIFMVFISAASFLSFRLGHLVRELELVRSRSNGVTMVRDFIYLPFVVIGQWMSDKYSKMNIITIVLDVLIEMPLKTILRLFRQWNAFIDERKDDLI